MHCVCTPQQWSCVMFSDESRFSLQFDTRRTLTWRVPGTCYHQENTIERHRYGGTGWLVWGGIILCSRTDLHVQSVNDDRPHLSGCHSGTTSLTRDKSAIEFDCSGISVQDKNKGQNWVEKDLDTVLDKSRQYAMAPLCFKGQAMAVWGNI
ncbi:HTH_Tnp_Tc3_2 domain-containing protein [Trichonephila clavipes]|nr:HTH_Tnp_Tc3_2 domain-containing protein [Trichonephila clavipes]